MHFKFKGREKEIEQLDKLYSRDEFSFAVVYGRRRVGKSSLINHFINEGNKNHISFMALEQSDFDNLRDFSKLVLKKFPKACSYISEFESWSNAFDYIVECVGEEKLIIFIDEFPYIANANPSISSVLQKYIDEKFKATKIKLILCGSSMSFMENQVLGHKSPLYGRRDMQFKILPFDYLDTAKICDKWSDEDISIAYALTSGVPHYLQKLIRYKRVNEGIVEEFLNVNGSLFEEPKNFLLQELREPSVYNTIIKAIAHGSSKLNEISTKTGEDNKKVSKYLSTLISLHIVQREFPITSKSERNGIYKLTDNLFRFWYKFIIQNNQNIQNGMGEYVLNKIILPEFSAYMGYIFEDMCIQYLNRQNKNMNLPVVYNQIGRWWGTNKHTKSQEEIDILAFCNNVAIFGECKWQNSVGESVLSDLKRKASLFDCYTEKYFYIFSKGGFTESLINIAHSDSNVILVTLEDLYNFR